MGATEELEALWSDVFGEPPPIRARPEELSRALVAHLPPAPAYMPQSAAPEPESAEGGEAPEPSDQPVTTPSPNRPNR